MALAHVLLIEDEQFSRVTLSAALTASGIDVVASGSTAAFALEMQRAKSIDVAVLDLDLGPGPTGVDIAVALRAQNRNIGIVFLTSYSDPRIAGIDRSLVPVGARFLTKSKLQDIDSLKLAILQAKHQPLKPSPLPKDADIQLTTHQIEIARLVASGMSNAQVAQQLGIGEKAVEHTLTRIYEVLGVDSAAGTNLRVQLARSIAMLAGKQLPSDPR